jgi:hypothetical protein
VEGDVRKEGKGIRKRGMKEEGEKERRGGRGEGRDPNFQQALTSYSARTQWREMLEKWTRHDTGAGKVFFQTQFSF